jgi:hypothetical protein
VKWVFKLKKDEAGVVIKCKARLVEHSFVQQDGIDYNDMFAPVVHTESVRLLALAAQEGWRVHHMDVKSAFLNGDLKEEVYVRQPPSYAVAGEEGKVYRLRKALYGLRQAKLHGYGYAYRYRIRIRVSDTPTSQKPDTWIHFILK